VSSDPTRCVPVPTPIGVWNTGTPFRAGAEHDAEHRGTLPFFAEHRRQKTAEHFAEHLPYFAEHRGTLPFFRGTLIYRNVCPKTGAPQEPQTADLVDRKARKQPWGSPATPAF
jgi:hypothetical protein